MLFDLSAVFSRQQGAFFLRNHLPTSADSPSSPNVTLSVYAHLMKGENQEAACRLENAIFEGTGHNLVTNENKGLTING